MRENQLYITSYEPEDVYGRTMVVLSKTVQCGDRSDYYWATLNPPISREKLGIGEDLKQVLLAPRFAGDSIDQAAETSIHVYICTVESDQFGAQEISPDDVRIVNWALLEGVLPEKPSKGE